MELNVCLYCEKRLADDNTAFCSIACQSKEASKSLTEVTYTTMKYHDTISYHRSPSLSYSTTTRKRKESILSSSLSHRPYFLMRSISTSTSFSSSLSDISVYSTPFSYEEKGNIHA